MSNMKCKAIAVVDAKVVAQTVLVASELERERLPSERLPAWEREMLEAGKRALKMKHPGCAVFFSDWGPEDGPFNI